MRNFSVSSLQESIFVIWIGDLDSTSNGWFSGLCFRKISHPHSLLWSVAISNRGVEPQPHALTSTHDDCVSLCGMNCIGNDFTATLEKSTRLLMSSQLCQHLRPVYPDTWPCYHSRTDHGYHILRSFQYSKVWPKQQSSYLIWRILSASLITTTVYIYCFVSYGVVNEDFYCFVTTTDFLLILRISEMTCIRTQLRDY